MCYPKIKTKYIYNTHVVYIVTVYEGIAAGAQSWSGLARRRIENKSPNNNRCGHLIFRLRRTYIILQNKIITIIRETYNIIYT